MISKGPEASGGNRLRGWKRRAVELTAMTAAAAGGVAAISSAADAATARPPAVVYQVGQQSSTIERIGWGAIQPVGHSGNGPDAWYLGAQGTSDGREPPNGALITLERNPGENPWIVWDVNIQPLSLPKVDFLRLSLRHSHNHDKALVGKPYKNPGGTALLGLQDGPGSELIMVTADPNYRIGTIVNPDNTKQVLAYPKLSNTGQSKHVLLWQTEASAKKAGEGTIWTFPPTEVITVEAQPDSVSSRTAVPQVGYSREAQQPVSL